jgi:Uma2 family endonuclease
MAINPEATWTPAAYLAFEREQSDAKHEYLDGRIIPMAETIRGMAGASLAHNRVVSNLVISLGTQMRGRPCDVFSGDMRIHVPATGLYTYPDISALCDTPRFEDDQLDVLLNPSIIIEVLSPSTEAYDRGAKFDHYRSIESLQTYVLIAQDRAHIELFRRQDNGWLLTVVKGVEASVRLEAIGCELALADVYERVL